MTNCNTISEQQQATTVEYISSLLTIAKRVAPRGNQRLVNALRREARAEFSTLGGAVDWDEAAAQVDAPSARPALPDTTGWTVDDFALALDGLRSVFDATGAIQNQPKALSEDGERRPGAEFIAGLGERWAASLMDDLAHRLATTRFADPEDEERRALRLLAHAATAGYGLGEALEMAGIR